MYHPVYLVDPLELLIDVLYIQKPIQFNSVFFFPFPTAVKFDFSLIIPVFKCRLNSFNSSD